MISSRDFDFIEGRLLAPSVASLEAYERLGRIGAGDLAERLSEAHSVFLVACRSVRRELMDRYQAERNVVRSPRHLHEERHHGGGSRA